MNTPYLVFCCYARRDELFLQDIKINLMSLEREGLITLKSDRDISSGGEWEATIRQYLAEASILLLLISPDFIASDYCFHEEMSRALERHAQGTARVVPVIVRPANWHRMPFGKLQALPRNAVPISLSPDRDSALMGVTKGVRLVVQELKAGMLPAQKAEPDWQSPVQECIVSTSQHERKTMSTHDNPDRPCGDGRGNIHGGQFTGGEFRGPIFSGDKQNVIYNPAPDKQKEGMLALDRGAKDLLNGDYMSARSQLRVAIDQIDPSQQKREAARARYLNALAILGYERPQDAGTAIRETLNGLLSVAIDLDRCDTYIMAKTLFLTSSLSRRSYNPQVTDYDRLLLTYMEGFRPDLYQQMRDVFGI
jgi:hypothetical protein